MEFAGRIGKLIKLLVYQEISMLSRDPSFQETIKHPAETAGVLNEFEGIERCGICRADWQISTDQILVYQGIPILPGILLFTKPSNTQQKQLVFEQISSGLKGVEGCRADWQIQTDQTSGIPGDPHSF